MVHKEVVLKKDNNLSFIVKLICSLSLFLWLSISHAEDLGRYISSEPIKLNDDLTIEAGVTVNFLGVLDVPKNVASSGRLATFYLGENIYNADAALFYKAIENANMEILPPKVEDNVGSAAICTTLMYNKTADYPVGLETVDLTQFIRVKLGERQIDKFSIRKPRDTTWSYRYRSNTDFCVQGLEHSKTYEITILAGIKGDPVDARAPLDTPITFVAKTPDMSPRIQVDSSKSILPLRSDPVIPVTVTNLDEFDIKLHRIDLASMSSYRMLFRILETSDLNRLSSFWAETVGHKTIQVDTKLNEEKELNLSLGKWLDRSKPGLYVATFQSEKLDLDYWDDVPTQWFMLSDIATQIYSGVEKTDIFLNSFDNLSALGEVEVDILAANNKNLFSGETDEAGRVSVPNSLLSGSDGFAPKFVIANSLTEGTTVFQIDTLKIKPRVLSGGNLKAYPQDAYLTTDRDIYRQSDKVNFFGVVRDLSLRPLANMPIKLILKKASGEEVYSSNLNTNAFGAFADAIQLRASYALGQYSIDIQNVEGEIITQQLIALEDYVPLTIEPKINLASEIWELFKGEEVSLSAEYFSGGAAGGLDASLAVQARGVRRHNNEALKDYIFGESESVTTKNADKLEAVLPENGIWSYEFFTDYLTEKNALYEVFIRGTVFDVGGRANSKTITVPLDTSPSYIGLLPNFDGFVQEGRIPSFNVINVDRAGESMPLEGASYKVNKIYYDYNWYYDDGWRWRRIRVDDDTVETGSIENWQLNLSKAPDWGRYEIIIKNSDGFTTAGEFYVGWGADVKPASEPEELSVYYDPSGQLKFDAPFSGRARVLIADTDIRKNIEFDVLKGQASLPVELGNLAEPGAHILVTLSRAIEEGTEHLPQLAMGRTWVENFTSERKVLVELSTPEKIKSMDEIELNLSISQEDGSAIIFLVDEGIHAINDYENLDLLDHYLSERELSLGVLTNFGQLILQDKSRDPISLGGDEITQSMSDIKKSDFFKTVSQVSPLIEFKNGQLDYTFVPSEMEGRLRAVALVVTEDGFGMTTEEIVVQDPVSLDISLPRFISPGSTTLGKLQVRWNDYSGLVKILTSVDGVETVNASMASPGDNFTVAIPFSVNRIGNVPVSIDIEYGDFKIRRAFELVSRSFSYPATELKSFQLAKKSWLGQSTTDIPRFGTSYVDIDAEEAELQFRVSPNLGVNLRQVVSALDRYPYGCIEQTSSGLRGVMAFADVNGLSRNVKKKINAGIDRIIAKQTSSGAFGYWNKYSSVYDRYQPYAIDTLQKSLAYAEDRDKVINSISTGLEYLYRTDLSNPLDQLYAYGLLARSGYEVTSRARYVIDQELKLDELITKVVANSFNIDGFLDELALAYWVSINIGDERRANAIHELIAAVLERAEGRLESHGEQIEMWRGPEFIGPVSSAYARVSAPRFGHLLASVSVSYITPEVQKLLRNTQGYLARKTHRSTFANSQIVDLSTVQQDSVAGLPMKLDGEDVELDQEGYLSLTVDQIKNGFEIEHNSKLPLVINAEAVGPRKGLEAVNYGYDVKKWWHDSDGNAIDLSSGVLNAEQGDLFTVVIEIRKSDRVVMGDLLLSDLLPAGFEIEKSLISPPKVGDLLVDLETGKNPDYTAHMDDRFIAHFESRWYQGNQAVISYVVRAAYSTEAKIGDAHVEHMYAPEIYGRSTVASAVVLEK